MTGIPYKYSAFSPLVNHSHHAEAGVVLARTSEGWGKTRVLFFVICKMCFSQTLKKNVWEVAIWPVLWYQSSTPSSLLKPLHPQLASAQNQLFASVGWMFPTLVFHKMFTFFNSHFATYNLIVAAFLFGQWCVVGPEEKNNSHPWLLIRLTARKS